MSEVKSDSIVTNIPLAALGRLNHHARAASGGQARAIYAYKFLATLILAQQKMLSLRCVKWTGKCNRCDDGRFQHWTWNDGYTVPCRDCGGTGVRTLRFVETTLQDDQIWHHPWDIYPRPGEQIAEAFLGKLEWKERDVYITSDGDQILWKHPGEWHPLIAAEKLPDAALIDLLNEVEDWVDEETRTKHGYFPFSTAWKTARRYLHKPERKPIWDEPSYQYGLHIGETTGCFVCGDSYQTHETHRRYGCSDSVVQWTQPLCNSHGDQPFPKAMPPELATPSVLRWRQRHEKAEAWR